MNDIETARGSVWDAVVAGGGPAGAAAALALAKAGRRVVMLERAAAPEAKIGETLPPAARRILQSLGIWERFLAAEHTASPGNTSAWGSMELHGTDFIYDRHGHGWQLDRERFERDLRDAACEGGVEVLAGAELTALKRDNAEWRLRVGVGGKDIELRSPWLVDATGRRCAIARLMGVHRTAKDSLIAIHAVFRTESAQAPPDLDTRTMIEAMPEGWWYTAQVPGGKRIVAYLTDADFAPPKTTAAEEWFCDQLAQTTHLADYLLKHDHVLADTPKATSAQTARLTHFWGDGWVAVGDAAMSFDPLSSQGMLTALYTGLKAGETIHAAAQGEAAALATYSERLELIHDAYWRNRQDYYQMEDRWAEQPFWKRRRSISAQPEVSPPKELQTQVTL